MGSKSAEGHFLEASAVSTKGQAFRALSRPGSDFKLDQLFKTIVRIMPWRAMRGIQGFSGHQNVDDALLDMVD